jgi:hypothetical protein
MKPDGEGGRVVDHSEEWPNGRPLEEVLLDG